LERESEKKVGRKKGGKTEITGKREVREKINHPRSAEYSSSRRSGEPAIKRTWGQRPREMGSYGKKKNTEREVKRV